ncbi:MAG: thioredoxin family protein [Eubacteriales bacterium]
MGLFGLGKKKEEVVTQEKESRIKVLGGGCAKCNELEAATVAALQEFGLEPRVEHVTDFAVIATYGVMTTPALVIDGKVVSMGRVLQKEEVLAILHQTERES